MLIFNGLKGLGDFSGNSAVTVGAFDGIHRGHQAIIKKLVRRAKSNGLVSIVITFEPRPVEVVSSSYFPPPLTPISEKFSLIERLGVDICLVLRFNKNFAKMEAEGFVRKLLLERLHTKIIVAGFNCRIGADKKKAGYFRSAGSKFGFIVEELSPVKVKNRIASSTLIRKLLEEGRVAKAADYIGRPYSVEGEVAQGKKRGALFGYPTANLKIPNVFIPSAGVYITAAMVDGRRYKAITNIGRRPTFEKKNHSFVIETHILDFTRNIYGQAIKISFLKRLRAETVFPSGRELREQVLRDEKRARAFPQKRV